MGIIQSNGDGIWRLHRSFLDQLMSAGVIDGTRRLIPSDKLLALCFREKINLSNSDVRVLRDALQDTL